MCKPDQSTSAAPCLPGRQTDRACRLARCKTGDELLPSPGLRRSELKAPTIQLMCKAWLCVQAAHNLHAMLAARALGCLAGVLPGARATPSNAPAQEALSCLLTPPLAIRLCDADPRTLLVQLASSTSNPQVGLSEP